MLFFIAIFLIAFIATSLATPKVIQFAVNKGYLDQPDPRKVHKEPTPRFGGIGIYFGFILAIIFALIFGYFNQMDLKYPTMFGILIASTIILILGAVDDIRGLKPLVKMFWQLLAAIILIFFSVGINFVSMPFGQILPLIPWIAIPLTILWIVGMTNAINLIDGLDGLASGVTAISAGTLFFIALRTHEIGAAILLLALFGATLAFLRSNFFPAKIFLGDSGSYFLGFILAASSIVGVFKTTLVVALIIPILILGVPIFDTMFAIGRRLSQGKGVLTADNKHIHHMLLRAGFTQREAVLSIYVVSFMLSMVALIMALQR